MRVRQVDRCPGKLDPGEYKRVPLNGPIFGIFLACPACGYRCITIHGESCADAGAPVADDAEGTLTVKGAFKCLLCRKPATILNGEFSLADA